MEEESEQLNALKMFLRTIEQGSNFNIQSSSDYDKSVSHIVRLIHDSYLMYSHGSYPTSAFLSITVVEEVAKVHVGLFVKDKPAGKDRLRDHVVKHNIGPSPVISIGSRLQSAIGADNANHILSMSRGNGFMKLRSESLYLDYHDGLLHVPYDFISKKLARELLCFAIEVFDDSLVGYTNYSISVSSSTDTIFEKLSKEAASD